MQSWFRHCDPAYAFFWESDLQPAGRWHGEGEGPVQYLADTPEGAWAELIRHEHLELAEDLADVRRSLWSISVLEEEVEGAGGTGRLGEREIFSDEAGYPRCRAQARALREHGFTSLLARSAALLPGEAGGEVTDDGLRPAAPADGKVLVLFGERAGSIGHRAVDRGPPPQHLLGKVRYLNTGRPSTSN